MFSVSIVEHFSLQVCIVSTVVWFIVLLLNVLKFNSSEYTLKYIEPFLPGIFYISREHSYMNLVTLNTVGFL